MPKIVAQADCRFKKAIGFLKKYQNMALPDAMKLADFSVREQACCAKRTTATATATAMVRNDNQRVCKGREATADDGGLTRGGGDKRAG